MSTHRGAVALFALLSLALAVAARAVDCERLRVAEVDYAVCRVDVRKERLQLVYDDGKPSGDFESLRESLAREGRKLTFAMNAGMFHADFRPVGLLVIDGKALAPINRAEGTGNFFLQPNGVFLVDGGARVLATVDYRNLRPRLATQSGPMLVHRGQIPASFAFRADSPSKYVRNGVCVQKDGRAAFVISDSPVNFHEFARVFQVSLRCDEALYLDGSISSLFAPQLERADQRAKLGPIFAVSE